MLERLGYAVASVHNGCEAVDAAAGSLYDLILMDCQMPEMDGYQAAAAIRRGETEGRHVPIVALTAHAMPGDRERCFESGMGRLHRQAVHAADARIGAAEMGVVRG